ncbi:tryptophan-rich sensory protein [Opitutia bacterium ISCC 51]|nr:tryptophan-rich sensory protein [Opitutae bacterium ISCC 51]QXD27662.1 tryptophan-rich sensory protein [Opitutae bacterium ISCC 52]
MILRIIVFLTLNFAALTIGGLSMGNGASSTWYLDLNKAPWTPPGWSFGAAWTLIMVCFSFYMSYAWTAASNTRYLALLYTAQWVLNTAWSPVFFRYHQSISGLVIISLLTLLVTYFLFSYLRRLRIKSLFILPYFLWLIIATSLNAYIVLYN